MIPTGKKNLWRNYQIDIADDRYYFVRSCIRQNVFPASEEIYYKVLRHELGRDIYDDPNQTTCTGIGFHSGLTPFDTTMTVIARDFSLMAEAGYENFVCSCVTTFGVFCEIVETWENFPEQEEKARDLLKKATGREFVKPRNLVHASDIVYKFRNEIAAKAKRRLINMHTGEPLKVVEHIGCHYAKIFPHRGVGGAEYPHVLAGMIESWGGDLVDYPERRHCCGFGFRQYLVKANRGYSLSNSKKKFDSMKPYKPDFILTNCPGCTFFLDRWQYVIGEMHGITYGENGQGIPVLTYEELAGLVLGYDPWDLGLQLHQVGAEPLLDKMGIDYDREDKYMGGKNKTMDMGRPEIPSVLKCV